MFTTNNQRLIKILQKELPDWFYQTKRDLPFRQTKNPYFIWVSEIMAQQTQIDTLIPYYNRFIEKFPDVFSLASASEDDVLKAWEGLGYYSRARNLHRAAKQIVSDHHGMMPDSYAKLIKLPGIGPYTGGAIASIAYNEKISAVDGNVLRVVSRYLNSDEDIGETGTRKKMTNWLETILPDAAGDFNEALMELGAMVCTPQNPKCLICPIVQGCQSHALGTTDWIPVKKKKQKQTTQKMEIGIVWQNGELYFVRRPNSGLLSGMWSFPITKVSKGNGLDIKQKLGETFSELSEPLYIGESRHVFSHVIWEMSVYRFSLPSKVCETAETGDVAELATPKEATVSTTFKSLSQVDELALPVAFSKLLPLLE